MEHQKIIRIIKRRIKDLGKFYILTETNFLEVIDRLIRELEYMSFTKHITVQYKNESKALILGIDGMLDYINEYNDCQIRKEGYIAFYRFLNKEGVYEEFMDKMLSSNFTHNRKKGVKILTLRDYAMNITTLPNSYLYIAFDWGYDGRLKWEQLNGRWIKYLKTIVNGKKDENQIHQ